MAAESIRGPSVPPQEPAKESPAEPSTEEPSTDIDPSHPEAVADAAADETAPAEDETHQAESWPKSAVERVRKLKEQRKALREKMAELEARLATDDHDNDEAEPSQTPKPRPETTPNPTVDSLTDPDEIARIVDQAQSTVDTIDDLLMDLSEDPESVERKLRNAGVKFTEGVEWTPSAMREFLRKVRTDARATAHAGPKRIEFVKQERQALSEVGKILPALSDKTSREFAIAGAMLNRFPALSQLPDWPIHVATWIIGRRALEAQQAKSQPAPATVQAKRIPNPPASVGAPATAPSHVKQTALEAARTRMKTQKGMSALEAYAKAAIAHSE
jgi:hypothetical protein